MTTIAVIVEGVTGSSIRWLELRQPRARPDAFTALLSTALGAPTARFRLFIVLYHDQEVEQPGCDVEMSSTP